MFIDHSIWFPWWFCVALVLAVTAHGQVGALPHSAPIVAPLGYRGGDESQPPKVSEPSPKVDRSLPLAYKSEEPEPGKSVEPPKEALSVVWVGQMETYPQDAVIKGNPCPAGLPMYSTCEVDKDCPAKMGCLRNPVMGTKFCCLKEEVVEYFDAVCPENSQLMSNKFCSEDQECGENGWCVKSFPVHVKSKKEGEQDEHKIVKMEIGACCTLDYDVNLYPKTMRSCPASTKPTRRFPCGLGQPACGLGSTCYYAEDAFGRCCAPENASAKTSESHLFAPGYGGIGGGLHHGLGFGLGHGIGYGGIGGHIGHHPYGLHHGGGYHRSYTTYRRYTILGKK